MRLVDSIEIRGEGHKRIELWQGDLTDLSADEAVDAVVVSAFPNDYRPTPKSLIGGLHAKGLAVAELALDKDIDIRKNYSCWLSRAVEPADPGLRFGRILCFEPHVRGRAPEVVGDIFRALTPIVAVRPEIRSVALPLVSTGDMGYDIRAMLEPLLDAAIHWLEVGLPLDRLAIVARSDASSAKAHDVFAKRKAGYLSPVVPPTPAFDYDVFVSYSHANAAVTDALVAALHAARADLKVFRDTQEIDVGAAWQIKIWESLERSRKVVAMLSPEYVASKACKEEFGIAWIRENRSGLDVLFPIYVYSADLPAFMLYRNYVDCREGDHKRFTDVTETLLAAIDG